MQRHEKNNFPIVEVFGSTFALLIVLFIIFNLFSEQDLKQRLENSLESGTYKISWENNSEGYIIILFPTSMLISQTNTQLSHASICSSGSAFVQYAKQIYSVNNKQIIFAIVEGATRTMKIARDCLRTIFPQQPISIGWIIANNELLKSVNLDDLPHYLPNEK